MKLATHQSALTAGLFLLCLLALAPQVAVAAQPIHSSSISNYQLTGVTAAADGEAPQRSSDHESDTLHAFNQLMFKTNTTLDKYLLRPVAVAWDTVVPDQVRTGVKNFFDNLGTPHLVANQLLQARYNEAAHSSARFIFNSTFGIAGLVDAGSTFLSLEKTDDADLGQTLAFWGVPQGSYLVLPILGPSTIRNLPDRAMSALLNPTYYAEMKTAELVISSTTEIINTRSYFLGIDQAIYNSIDPYKTTRNIYLQSRNNLIQKAGSSEQEQGDQSDMNNAADDSFFDSVE